MSYICYTVNSWKYDNFLNRKYDETFDCWWEHIEGDAYNKAVKCYETLLTESKVFKDKMLVMNVYMNLGMTVVMNVVMKKKTHNDIRHTTAFPDKEETLFDTRGI